MPKDEFDFNDPFELNGMVFCTEEDTTDAMSECFIEEFLRMGYNHRQILALFCNPHYVGPHLAYQKRGEPHIRDLIADIFARWGKPAGHQVPVGHDVRSASAGDLPVGHGVRSALAGDLPVGHDVRSAPRNDVRAPALPPPASPDPNPAPTDPMGGPIPTLNL